MNREDRRAEYLAGSQDNGADARLNSLRAVLADETTWAVPPQSVLDQLIDRIGSERADSARPARRWTLQLWPRLAFAVLAIAVVAVAWVAFSDSPQARVTLAGTELEPSANGIAQLSPTGAGWSIEIEVADLPPAGDGYYYEAWVWNETGDGVSIGTFHLRGGPEPVQMWAGVDVAEYPWIWISLQREGGGAEVSDQVVMRGKLDP